MDNAQNQFWQYRIQKEDAMVRRMMHKGAGNGLANQHKSNADSIWKLLTDTDNYSVVAASALTASTANNNSNNKQHERKSSALPHSAAAAAAAPIKLPHRETRAVKLLPQIPGVPAAASSNSATIPLTRDVLEEQTFTRLMEQAAARKKSQRQLNGQQQQSGSAPQNNNLGDNNRTTSRDGVENLASARSSQISSLKKQVDDRQDNNGGDKKRGNDGRSSSSTATSASSAVGKWAANVPTALPPIQSARGSAAASESAFSATTLSHRAASSALVSGVTSINRRLEAIEQRIGDEKGLRDDLRKALMEVRAIVEKSKHQNSARGNGSASASSSKK